MLKKTLTYTDFNDEERTEDFYFNLTEAELADMEITTIGGLTETMEKISKAKDKPALAKIFKEFILKAYGEKSPDGKRFMKSDEIRKAFEETQAYSDIYMELATDADKASDFFKKILPSKLINEKKNEDKVL